ncbi:MAG: C25 family cysteine peptidase [Reichenbachiella sp.]
MIKNRLFIWCLLFITTLSVGVAQPYGNEWIDFNQNYFKISIGENGIYKLTRTELASAGFPVGSVDPRKIQLFHLGQEIALHVEGESDGSFGTNDFIEFYGKVNDGTTDTPLYIEENNQPHTYYNIFSDTAAYFLTYKLNTEFGVRMDEFYENNVGNLSPESYFTDTVMTVLHNNYFEGQSYGFSNEIILGSYDQSEGWTGSRIKRGSSVDYTITGLIDSYQTGTLPHISFLLSGRNNNSHNATIQVGANTSSLRTLTTAEFDKDELFSLESDLQWSDISAGGELVFRMTVNGVNGIADNISVSFIKVDYTRSFDFSGLTAQDLKLQTQAGNKSYIEIQNQPTSTVVYDITSISSPVLIGLNDLANELNFMVDNTSTVRQLYLQSDHKSVGHMEAVSFQEIDPSQYNYLIIGHPKLRANTSDNQTDQVAAYTAYRSSIPGGGHTVLDLDIDQVFDQFNYGHYSPLAIRNIAKYFYDNGGLDFLFLIGKSSNVQANYYRQDPEIATVRHLVPAFGYPGADVPFSTGFDGGSSYESVATGRINASEPDHVQAYLNKIIEEESLPYDNLWRKDLVQLSGGNTEQELNTFRGYIDNFADIAAQEIYGGESSQISKNNNSAVELINISDEINDGVTMVTFFGHSSGSVTDIEIGLVSDPSYGYANKGKYPTFIVNGCLAGDFFSEKESFGVDWILTPDLGASAFMAHSHVGFSSSLRRFTDIFYELSYNDSIYTAQGVGQIKKETAKRFIETYGNNAQNQAQVELFNLQGDPAAKVFGANKSNYSINQNLIEAKTFNNEQLLATVDSFYLAFDIKNFGIYDNTPLAIQVVRTLADGTNITYGPLVYDPILRQDTLTFTINNEINNPEGENTFRIEVDPFSTIDELDKQNNVASIELFLSNGSSANLLPENYGIYTEPMMEFYFQTSNLLSDTRSFNFELDTTSTFNSPFLTTETISAKVIGRHLFDLTSRGVINNGQVFFWRTKLTDPLPNEIDEWVTSSFTYDTSENEGWGQHNTSQLAELNLDGLSINTSGVWEFATSELGLQVQNYGSNHPTSDYNDTRVLINGRNYFNSNSTNSKAACRNNTINFLSFQRQSLAPFRPFDFSLADELNPLVCGLLPQYILNYTTGDFTGSTNPIEYINTISSGDKVLIFSLGQVDYTAWTDEFKTALESLGISRTTLDNLSNDEPLIFLGTKNTVNPATEILALTDPKNENTLFLDTDLVGSFDTGSISTNKIGPALSWSNINLNITPSDNPLDDINSFSYIGITTNGNEVNLGGNSTDLNYDISSIDADDYPYLRFQLKIEDPVASTPAQLKAWKVNYFTAPEGILLPNENTNYQDSLIVQEGQETFSSFTFWNYSNKAFTDSIKTIYEIQNASKSLIIRDTVLLAPLAAGDSTRSDIGLTTVGNDGENDLLINVNKGIQKEVYSTNNSLRLTKFMTVELDEVNPILEVTIDGIRIMDGDIVSPNPQIRITMNDDNHYLVKSDTVGMNLNLKRPCETCDYERIPFTSSEITWTAANEENDFSIEYLPTQLEDGIYYIKVQVSDASGNESGIKPYEISFEVINESTITNFYPYPNPFSTSTRFVFTLTGNEIPEDIKIQILTISGRVVKEIFMNELGTIRIGNNITDYAWNGKDEFEDQLANGVYLYRVLIKNAGENFQHRITGGDRGFKNGYGKMYLLR